MNVNSVLCICTGNICRSPYAEGLLRRDLPSLRVSSAGIGAVVGGQMPAPAAQIAERDGLELANHRGRQVTSDMLREHDLVLVMEAGQRQWLTDKFPESRGRVFLASHWRDGEDVPDPYRHSGEFFEEVFAGLTEYVEDWTAKLRLSSAASQDGPRSA